MVDLILEYNQHKENLIYHYIVKILLITLIN